MPQSLNYILVVPPGDTATALNAEMAKLRAQASSLYCLGFVCIQRRARVFV